VAGDYYCLRVYQRARKQEWNSAFTLQNSEAHSNVFRSEPAFSKCRVTTHRQRFDDCISARRFCVYWTADETVRQGLAAVQTPREPAAAAGASTSISICGESAQSATDASWEWLSVARTVTLTSVTTDRHRHVGLHYSMKRNGCCVSNDCQLPLMTTWWWQIWSRSAASSNSSSSINITVWRRRRRWWWWWWW